MPHEYSVGIIIFHGREYLLIKYKAGHWGFAKGKPYTGEPRVDAARREVKEETGISGIFLARDFMEKEEYFFKKMGKTVHKEVDYFLGESPSKNVKLSEEHVEYKWLIFEEAMGQVTYRETKDVLKKANDFRNLHA